MNDRGLAFGSWDIRSIRAELGLEMGHCPAAPSPTDKAGVDAFFPTLNEQLKADLGISVGGDPSTGEAGAA